MDQDIPLTIPERQNQILSLLTRQPRISVTAICEQFGVSEATARREDVVGAVSMKVHAIQAEHCVVGQRKRNRARSE